MTYTPEKGDRVRVTYEADVYFANGSHFNTRGEPYGQGSHRTADVTVEKIEPAVEVFQPGDVVRHKVSNSVYTVTNNRALVGHSAGRVYSLGRDWFDSAVTSEHYERVTLP